MPVGCVGDEAAPPHVRPSPPFATRTAAVGGSDLQELMSFAEAGDLISLAGGFPDERAFDYDRIAAVGGALLADPTAWQYAPTEGFSALREAIGAWMAGLNLTMTQENILITHGSQQGLDLVGKVFLDPGDLVITEAPAYIGGLNALESYEARIETVPVDRQGLRTELLARRLAEGGAVPTLVYVIPNFQNPSGVTLAVERRRHLAELAAEYGFVVAEDDAYGGLRYAGEPLPPVASFDREGRVLYLGSFSKILIPGIRVGWVAATPEIIEKLLLMKQGADLCSNSFGQRFVLEWLDRYPIQPPAQHYRAKRDRLLAALESHLPAGCSWNSPAGGFFIWLELPEGVDARRLLSVAYEEGVAFVPGAAFRGPTNSCRLAYGQVPAEQIEPGIERFARALRRVMQENGGSGPH